MKKKVFVYVDGFNLYHALKKFKQPHLLWLNLRTLAEKYSYKEEEEIDTVYYFSAIAHFLYEETQERHQDYIEALQAFDVEFVQGNFKKKEGTICKAVRKEYNIPKPPIIPNYIYEEKETDVNIAIHIVADAIEKKCDKMLIISNDTDLNPAIKMAKKKNPSLEIRILTPPKHTAHYTMLAFAEQKKPLKIVKRRLEESLLPEIIHTEKRIIKIPEKYKS